MSMTIYTKALSYNASNKTFTGFAASFSIEADFHPDLLTIESAKGGRKEFVLASEGREYLELQVAIYKCEDMFLHLHFGTLPASEQAAVQTVITAPNAPVVAPVKSVNKSVPMNIDKAAARLGKVVMFQYDIPTASRFGSPCGILRRLGIRITKSVWAIQDNRLPWHLLDEMSKVEGIIWHVVQFSDSEAAKLIQLAETNLKLEVEQAQKNLEESLESALQAYQESQEEGENQVAPDRAQVAYQLRCRQATQRCENLVKDLTEAAKAFGVYDAVTTPFAKVISVTRVLGAQARARTSAYMDLAEKAKGTQMEVAANEDSIPAGVLADYLEDEGIEVGNVRDMF